MVLGAWWLVIAVGALWRRTVWREGGQGIREVLADRGGELRATWAGYELRAEGLRVRWRGGLRGPATVVHPDGAGRTRVARWLDVAGVHDALGRAS